MARWALFFGLVLVILGIFAYEGGNHTSAALMPGYFGILLGVLGATARTGKEKTRMVAMHIAATVGVVGFLVTASSMWQYVQMQRSQYIGDKTIVEEHAATSVILLVFVLLCVLSFIGARRGRQAGSVGRTVGSR
jgi:uncharacterized membrane protein